MCCSTELIGLRTSLIAAVLIDAGLRPAAKTFGAHSMIARRFRYSSGCTGDPPPPLVEKFEGL